MTDRKTPVLLRRAPLSGGVSVLTRYTIRDGALRVAEGGKHDVTGDFAALLCGALIDADDHGCKSGDIAAILDGVADGEPLTDEQRVQVRAFRERLAHWMETNNKHVDVGTADG